MKASVSGRHASSPVLHYPSFGARRAGLGHNLDTVALCNRATIKGLIYFYIYTIDSTQLLLSGGSIQGIAVTSAQGLEFRGLGFRALGLRI